jgi:hypothetical protein
VCIIAPISSWAQRRVISSEGSNIDDSLCFWERSV